MISGAAGTSEQPRLLGGAGFTTVTITGLRCPRRPSFVNLQT
jgi:hypothetical protein